MKNTLLLLLFVFPFSVFAQQFPEDYAGTYTGSLYLLSSENPDSIPCAIIIAPTKDPNRWTNKMIFDYEREIGWVDDHEWVRDPENGTWQIDQKDGILITETLIDNTFYAHYKIEGMLFFMRTCFHDGVIDYELTVFESGKYQVSASTEDGTEVRSFPVMGVQKGTFQKEK